MESDGFVYEITSDSLVMNGIPSSESPSNCKPCIKTSPPSKSSSSSPGSNRCSIGDQPCPGHRAFLSGKPNGETFWKSLQRNVRKYMGCFRLVATRPKDAGRVQPTKLAGNGGVRNAEEHDENLKALIHHCKNS